MRSKQEQTGGPKSDEPVRRAAAFHFDDVTPLTGHRAKGHFSEPLACADNPESGFLVERDTGRVFLQYAGRQRPDTGFFGSFDQILEQHQPHALSGKFCSDIDADFRDAGIDAARGGRAKRRPAGQFVSGKGAETRARKMRLVPFLPAARIRLKSRMAGINALLVNIQNSRGMLITQMSCSYGDMTPPLRGFIPLPRSPRCRTADERSG